ncbi:Lactonase, 7-bladed beta-propeller-domain-containing protein [Aspergillus pseudoustus]|uniref:Lactonase, 7-bladed beta-propeller-domain-containing protein n=1 Tax=Aspergillus pseudoustus TaxID=1810923 RepID=A0ABR4KUN7_9EURO
MLSRYTSTLVLLSFGLASAVPATKLYATHYSTKTVYTLSLDRTSNGSYALTEASSLETCGTYPSWITFDSATRTIYCSDEYGWKNANESVNGSLTALAAAEDGTLSEIAVTGSAPGSGVHNVIYDGEDGQFLAVAHYSGSAISTYKLPLEGNADPLQVFEFELSGPGAVPDRQEAPHPHQALLDPTGGFVLVPDLGADLVRVFAIDKSSGKLSTCPSLNYTAGGGPRHGVFWTGEDAPKIRGRAPGAAPQTILYVAGELNGEVEAFAVSYPTAGCLGFRQIDVDVPYPEALPEGASLGEIRLAGDNIYVSVRLDAAFDGDDSLANLRRGGNGTLAFKEITSSNGVLPRTFAINKAGDLVAVGNQLSSNVAIVTRDPDTGALGEVVADLVVGVPGEPNTLEGLSSIIWDE